MSQISSTFDQKAPKSSLCSLKSSLSITLPPLTLKKSSQSSRPKILALIACSYLLIFAYFFVLLLYAISGTPSFTAAIPAASRAISLPPVTSTTQSGFSDIIFASVSLTSSMFSISALIYSISGLSPRLLKKRL